MMLKKNITNNKKQAQQFIASIIKIHDQTDDQTDTSSMNSESIDNDEYKFVSNKKKFTISKNI